MILLRNICKIMESFPQGLTTRQLAKHMKLDESRLPDLRNRLSDLKGQRIVESIGYIQERINAPEKIWRLRVKA